MTAVRGKAAEGLRRADKHRAIDRFTDSHRITLDLKACIAPGRRRFAGGMLRHLLGTEAQALVSDAILARVRGMILDLAAQLLAVQAGHDPATRGLAAAAPSALDPLADALMADEALLAFCHVLAAEGLIAQRLQQRHAIDPVLSPLLQELIASEDTAIAGLAMSTLAAQSRFVQGQRRMELPIAELPLNLFLLLGMGGSIGFISGLFGVGGGFLLTPLLIFVGVPAPVAVATKPSRLSVSTVDTSLMSFFIASLLSSATPQQGG